MNKLVRTVNRAAVLLQHNIQLTQQILKLHTTTLKQHGAGCGCGSSHNHPPTHNYEHKHASTNIPEPIELTEKQAQQYLNELTTLKQDITTQYQLGQYEQALLLQNQYTQIIQQLYSIDNIRYAVSVNNEALFNKLLGNTKRALHLYKLALNIYDTCNEHNTINYAIICHNIGTIYRDLNDMENATQYLNTALQLHKQCNLNNVNIVNIATTQYTIASIYRVNKQYDQAITMQLDSITLLKRKYGPDDIHVASAYNNLGYTYKCAEQYDNALKYYSDALHIRSRELPPAHHDTIVTLNNIAELHSAMGNEEHSNKVRQYIIELVQAHEAKQDSESVKQPTQ